MTSITQAYCIATLPTLVATASDRTQMRFLEFFTANIRNPNTRKAYARAAAEFFCWAGDRGVTALPQIQPLHVAAYIEDLGRHVSVPTVKQRLAALRHLFDWLVTGQVIPTNPAGSVRGPKHSVRRGKTPVLSPLEARHLLESIPTDSVAGLRDRALIGLMVYSFARIGAALAMKLEDVYIQDRRTWVRLHEKGGKRHEMPCHHNLETWLHGYIDETGLAGANGPLFRTIDLHNKQLSNRPLPQANAYAMIQRRTRAAGINTRVCCHTFRATGITAYLKNAGTLEKAAQMANHASTRTTQLYDRRSDEVSLDEVERILI
jgi:site-specific recombinase XerD